MKALKTNLNFPFYRLSIFSAVLSLLILASCSGCQATKDSKQRGKNVNSSPKLHIDGLVYQTIATLRDAKRIEFTNNGVSLTLVITEQKIIDANQQPIWELSTEQQEKLKKLEELVVMSFEAADEAQMCAMIYQPAYAHIQFSATKDSLAIGEMKNSCTGIDVFTQDGQNANFQDFLAAFLPKT